MRKTVLFLIAALICFAAYAQHDAWRGSGIDTAHDVDHTVDPEDYDVLQFDITVGTEGKWVPQALQLDTTNFDNNLSDSDTNVQTALETLDELAVTGAGSVIGTKGIWFETPTAADDFKSIWGPNGFGVTLTAIKCETSPGTSTALDLQIDDGSVADVNGTDIVCGDSMVEDESLGGDTGLDDDEQLDLAITSVSGAPSWISIQWSYKQ